MRGWQPGRGHQARGWPGLSHRGWMGNRVKVKRVAPAQHSQTIEQTAFWSLFPVMQVCWGWVGCHPLHWKNVMEKSGLKSNWNKNTSRCRIKATEAPRMLGSVRTTPLWRWISWGVGYCCGPCVMTRQQMEAEEVWGHHDSGQQKCGDSQGVREAAERRGQGRASSECPAVASPSASVSCGSRCLCLWP